jgi:hypothetical protein
VRLCSYFLILHWTILTYQRIDQSSWCLLYFHSCLFTGIEWRFNYLKFWCFGTRYRCVKLNFKLDLSFLGQSQFDCGFLDLYVHEIHISWYQSKTLYQVISFLHYKLEDWALLHGLGPKITVLDHNSLFTFNNKHAYIYLGKLLMSKCIRHVCH